MKFIERRLVRLERLPQFQPPPTWLQRIEALALGQVSDEDLKLLIRVYSDEVADFSSTFSMPEFLLDLASPPLHPDLPSSCSDCW